MTHLTLQDVGAYVSISVGGATLLTLFSGLVSGPWKLLKGRVRKLEKQARKLDPSFEPYDGSDGKEDDD